MRSGSKNKKDFRVTVTTAKGTKKTGVVVHASCKSKAKQKAKQVFSFIDILSLDVSEEKL